MSPRTDVQRLADMRAALLDIRQLTAGGKNSFKAVRHTQQAVAYNLAVLGEAARALSPELRQRYPDVPWLDMIDTRNVAVHEYHRLDAEILWTTATENLRYSISSSPLSKRPSETARREIRRAERAGSPNKIPRARGRKLPRRTL